MTIQNLLLSILSSEFAALSPLTVCVVCNTKGRKKPIQAKARYKQSTNIHRFCYPPIPYNFSLVSDP
jgi:hypothetical protein